MRSMFQGLLPALVQPFHPTGSIDEESFSTLAKYVAGFSGVTGVVVNGHAGEVSSLRREERRSVVELAVGSLPTDVPVISGLAVETPEEAVEHAADAQEAGASGLLVLPPHLWLIGREPDAAQEFFRALTAEVDVPVIVFQYPAHWGAARYKPDELLDLTSLPHVEAVKDASWEISAYEEDYKLLKRQRPEVAVLSANDEHVLTSFVIGADGALLGFGSIAAGLITEILDATKQDDLARARAADHRLYPLTRAFYKTTPKARMHSRIKHGLLLQDLIASDFVRPPLQSLSDEEHASVRNALEVSGMLA